MCLQIILISSFDEYPISKPCISMGEGTTMVAVVYSGLEPLVVHQRQVPMFYLGTCQIYSNLPIHKGFHTRGFYGASVFFSLPPFC